MTGNRQDGRAQRERGRQGDEDSDRRGQAQALKVGQPGETEARDRAGNRQARAQDDVRGAAVHGVEGVFPLFAGGARLVISADEKYRVIRSGGDHQQCQQIGRICRQSQNPDIAQEGNESPRGGHLDQDGRQDQERGGKRSIDEEQHHGDHADGDRGDFVGSLTAFGELVGDQRGGTGEVGLDARRWLHVVDGGADRVDGLVRRRLALGSVEKELNVGGLAVAALGSRRRQRVSPEVLDVLNVLLVLFQFVNHRVIEFVGVGAEWLVAFQDDHRRTVGVELVEYLADVFERLIRRRLGGAEADVVQPADLFQLRHKDIRHGRQRHPEQQDGHRQAVNGVRDDGTATAVIAHPDLSRQKV